MRRSMLDAAPRRDAVSPSDTESPAVVFDRVRKSYVSGEVAVDGTTFEVKQGELLVLLGPSGCGKTTSLRLIAGLEEPDSGSISIHGRTVSDTAKGIFVPIEKRNIGMVFQSYAIWPHMSVHDNVAYPLRARRLKKREAAEKVDATLNLVGLEGMGSRSATRLSGGQQQRVALARALVFNPNLLLLDEPLSNLDAKLRLRMRVEFKDLQRRMGVTSVFVTHDQVESMALADRIVVMNHGRIEQVGTPEEIYTRPRSQFVSEFIGSINMIKARILTYKDGDEEAEAEVAGIPNAVRCACSPDVHVSPGDDVLLSIRPEAIALNKPKDAPGLDCGWKGKIVAQVYYGDHRLYDVAVGEARLSVKAPPQVQCRTGDDVSLSFNSKDVSVIRAE